MWDIKKRFICFVSALSMLAVLFTGLPISSQAEGNIKIGDYIQMGKYYNKAILWRCVDIDENGPLMLSDKILCLKAFDAKGTNIRGSHGRGLYAYDTRGYFRQEFGSDYWADSNIRDWLNSVGGPYGVIWSCENPPTSENCYKDNSYEDEAGFLSNFTQTERDAIKTVTQKSILDRLEHSKSKYNEDFNPDYHRYSWFIDDVVQNYDTAYSEQVTDTMFLLDVKQISNVYNNRDILGDQYYMGYPTEEAVANSDYQSEYLTPDLPWVSWLRSPYADIGGQSGEDVRVVAPSGSITSDQAYEGAVGVRPAFYLNLSSCSIGGGSGTETDPYLFSKYSCDVNDYNYSENMLTVNESITNDTDESKDLVSVIPIYTEDGRFKAFSTNTINALPNSSTENTQSVNNYSYTQGDYMKPILLGGNGNLNILSPAKKITLQIE